MGTMAAGRQTTPEPESDPAEPTHPAISICEGAPGTSVFLEADNTDGWIASDVTVAVHR